MMSILFVIFIDVPMKPRTEAQDSRSETDSDGHKQSEKQYSVGKWCQVMFCVHRETID